MEAIFGNLLDLEPRLVIMWIIGGILIYLAIKKDMEPSLLLPMGFGAILVNLPNSGAITQGEEIGVLNVLYDAGIANELFPLLLFIGIGAMIDFGPLLQSPYLLIFGAAAQLGIFVTVSLACLFGFELKDAASIGIIGAADGPHRHLRQPVLREQLHRRDHGRGLFVHGPGADYPAPGRQAADHQEGTDHPYEVCGLHRIKQTRILFPILVTLIAGLIVPRSVALVGFLMFGNLLRECGVLDSLSKTAQDVLANLITIFLGITIASQMQAESFLNPQTLLILALGLFAFIFDTFGGVVFAKILNIFLPQSKKINPMIGACGISAFPMSSRVISKMALKEDNSNYLLMQAAGVNVGGQIASVIAGGMIINLIAH